MGYRKFVDRDEQPWEVRDKYRSEWYFEPLPGNVSPRATVEPPGYEKDPFEMSDQELQKLLDSAGRDRGRSGSRSGDGAAERPKKKSPFLD